MFEGLHVISTPQLGVNDEVAIVTTWYVPDEGTVSSGQPICALETTKALFDVEAEAAGYVVHLVNTGVEVKVSEPIALIGSRLEILRREKNQYVGRLRTERGSYEAGGGSLRATERAKVLAHRLGVDLAKLPVRGIVREQDVREYFEGSRVPDQKQLAVEISWDPARKPVIIYGAGRGAVTLRECLELQGPYHVVGFIDDDPESIRTLCGLPVYNSSRLEEVIQQGVRSLAGAIARGEARLRILRKCETLSIDLINVIHPRAYIAPSVKMGTGNYIKAGAIIDTNAVVGSCCIIDNGAVIAHDSVIGDGCHIAPGVVMGSDVHIGELAVVGIGASIGTGVRIGRSTIISVGSSVVRNASDYSIIEGIPGKVVGKRRSS